MNSRMNFPGWLILGLIFLPLCAPAADWPQWRGPDRTAHVPTSEPVPTALAAEPKILWHIKVGFGLSSPVVADGKVFYSDDQSGEETLHAIKASDGAELWSAAIDKSRGDNQSAPGPRCTPTADGPLVFAQSVGGELRCFKTSDGSAVWSVNYPKDFGANDFVGENGPSEGAALHGYAGAPVVDSANLYAAVGGTKGESVVCFEKTTGKVNWKSQNDEAAYAAPIVTSIGGVRQLVHFTADGVIGLDLGDGKLLWRSPPMKTSSARHVTTPVVSDDLVVVASYQIGLVAVKVSRNGSDWQAAETWTNKYDAMNFSSPVAVGDYLYGLGLSRNFICVEIKTGKLMWSQGGYITSAGVNSYAAFVVMGGNVLALTDGGELVLFAADPKGFKEISRVQVCGKTWCYPAYAEGKLFLRDARELMCVGLMP